MELAHDVEISAAALAEAAPEMVPVLRQLQGVTTALSALFARLATAPDAYPEARAEIERLVAERAPLVQRLGELAARVLVLREACTEAVAEPVSETPAAAVPPPSVPPPAPRETQPVASPPPPPVSQQQLEQFFAAKTLNGAARTPSVAEDKTVLLSLANHVTIASETPADLDGEILVLERATDEARMPVWRRMSAIAQVRWVELLVAWAKALEGEARAKGRGEERVRSAFRRLRAFSVHESPGFIYGFAREADPRGASWRHDAADALAGLRGRLRENEAPKPMTAVDDELEEEDDDDERDSKVPQDWAYFEHVKGKAVVMLGGEAREERRVALEKAFQMASLTWVPKDRPRMLQSLTERAAQGSIDIILVNKFVAHKETIALEKASVAPIITLRHGYGITAVKTAIEDWFSRA